MNRQLHIICNNVPWPVNNSKSIDTFCQIEALYKQGIKIHLHYLCPSQNCHPAELNKYCESVHTYPSEKPRTNTSMGLCEGYNKIITALSCDNHPVLFEDISCTETLKQISGSHRKVVVRMYDDKCRQNDHLARSAGSFFQKIRLNRRTNELKKQEDMLPKNCIYAFPTPEITHSSEHDHQLKNARYLPVFSPFHEVMGKTGHGNFCLYHGDLADPCNEKAALWLLTKVFNDINTPLVIAGNDPGKQLQKLGKFYSHTCLIANPSRGEIEDLVTKAQIHVLPSFSYKLPELKLIHAIAHGRHCIVNENAVKGTIYESACHIGKNAGAFKSIILQLYHQPFEQEEIELRKKIFRQINKEEAVTKLTQWLFT
ncbi:MAG: mannosyltransferase [Chitinophagaceae bacterium]